MHSEIYGDNVMVRSTQYTYSYWFGEIYRSTPSLPSLVGTRHEQLIRCLTRDRTSLA